MLGHSGSLAYEPWPVADESLLVQSTYNLPVQVCGVWVGFGFGAPSAGAPTTCWCEHHVAWVGGGMNAWMFERGGKPPPLPCPPTHVTHPTKQVNGKMRGAVEVPVDMAQEGAVAAAQAIPAVAKQLEGKAVKKIIFVPGKILNLIVPGK